MKNILFILIIWCWISPNMVWGNAQSNSIFDLLETEKLLDIEIRTDLENLLYGEGEKSYIAAQLSYKDKAGAERAWMIETRQRGKYRRKVCDFPPIKLRFDKQDLEEHGLKSFHTLKLVTHCLDDADVSRATILKEYLAYKMYNVLTDKSFRVQLVRVNWRDSATKKKIRRYGFLIENHHEMAARLGGEIVDVMNPDLNRFDPAQENMAAMYQYFVGNEDYDPMVMRNLKMVQPKDGSPAFFVPYDFDFAGLVDAPYAVPTSGTGLQSVRERFFRGYFRDRTLTEATLSRFAALKEELIDEVYKVKKLDPISRDEVLDYIETFYLALDYNTIMTNADANRAVNSTQGGR